MFKSVIFVVTAIAGVVFAQLPSCAQTCVVLPAACPNPEPSCICAQSDWIQQVACCVFATCTTESDRDAVINYANSICKPVGVTLPTTASNCTSNGTAVSTSSMSSSMGSSMTSSMSSAMSSARSSASSAASSASSATASVASSAFGNKVAVAEGAGFVGALLGFLALL